MKTLEDFKKEINITLSENKKRELDSIKKELNKQSLEKEALEIMQYIVDFIKENPKQKNFKLKHPKDGNFYCVGYYRMHSGQTIRKDTEIVSLIKKYCLECGLKPINYEDDDDNIYLGVSLE